MLEVVAPSGKVQARLGPRLLELADQDVVALHRHPSRIGRLERRYARCFGLLGRLQCPSGLHFVDVAALCHGFSGFDA
jgi:hypothetical protein